MESSPNKVTVTPRWDQSPLPLAGFYVIEAGDMDEAIELLSKTPCAHAGAYEIRPLTWRAA